MAFAMNLKNMVDNSFCSVIIRYSEEELQAHIDKLHEYNEIKDVGQLLIGKLGMYITYILLHYEPNVNKGKTQIQYRVHMGHEKPGKSCHRKL